MSEATCDVKEGRRTPYGPMGMVIFRILNNRAVEAILVAFIAIAFIATAVIDGILGTKTERKFIDSLRDVSRDKLSSLRKAQIRYVFRYKFGLRRIKIRLAGGSYWLSIPCVVKGRKHGKEVKYMAKIINGMSAIKHRYMTQLRNLGVLAGAANMRFDEYTDAKDMAYFERHCLTMMKGQSIAVPAVIGMYRLNEDDYMLVTEFIEGKPLSEVDVDGEQVDQVFRDIKTMHEHGFVHGDIKLDNFLVSRGKVFVVDCLKVGSAAFQAAISFDTICALCAMCQKVPVGKVMEHARRHFSEDELRRAGQLLDIAVSKVDIDLPEDRVRELRRALGNPL